MVAVQEETSREHLETGSLLHSAPKDCLRVQRDNHTKRVVQGSPNRLTSEEKALT